MKTYIGIRQADGRATVHVVESETGDMKPLTHIERHSPTGLEWGYNGSGPADTALSILTDALRNGSRYQDFKFEVIGLLPQGSKQQPGPMWAITVEQVRQWARGEKITPTLYEK